MTFSPYMLECCPCNQLSVSAQLFFKYTTHRIFLPLFSICLVDELNSSINRLYSRCSALEWNGGAELEQCPHAYGFLFECLCVLHTNIRSPFDYWSVFVNCLQVHQSPLLPLAWVASRLSLQCKDGSPSWK